MSQRLRMNSVSCRHKRFYGIYELPLAKSQLIIQVEIMASESLETPPRCTADFCLIPIGTPTASVSREVAEVQRLLQKSGLKFSMHSAGTTVDGSWDEVMKVIGQAHSMLHARGIVRIQSDIRVGTRIDKAQGFEEKVAKVERLLREDAEHETGEAAYY